MADTQTTDTAATTTSGVEGINTQAAGTGAATGAADTSQAASGVARTYTDTDFAAAVKKSVDGHMGAARKQWEKELADKAAEADLSAKDLLAKREAEYKAQLTERDGKLRQTELKLHVFQKARVLGLTDPEAALKLADLDTVEYDDKGQPTNLDVVLKAAADKYPALLTAPQPAASTNGVKPLNPLQPTNPAKAGALSMEAIEAMSLDEYGARRPEIFAFLEAQPKP